MAAFGTRDSVSAGKSAWRLMQNKEVKEYIEKELSDLRSKAKVDAQKILELLADIAFTSPAHFASILTEGGKQKILWKDVEVLPENMKRVVSVIKNTPSGISVETLDRIKAIDLLMKYLGMEKGISGGVVIEGEGAIEE